MTSVADQMKVAQKADEGGETPPPTKEDLDDVHAPFGGYMAAYMRANGYQTQIGDEFDNILAQEGLDWSYDKPDHIYFETIYIIKVLPKKPVKKWVGSVICS